MPTPSSLQEQMAAQAGKAMLSPLLEAFYIPEEAGASLAQMPAIQKLSPDTPITTHEQVGDLLAKELAKLPGTMLSWPVSTIHSPLLLAQLFYFLQNENNADKIIENSNNRIEKSSIENLLREISDGLKINPELMLGSPEHIEAFNLRLTEIYGYEPMAVSNEAYENPVSHQELFAAAMMREGQPRPQPLTQQARHGLSTLFRMADDALDTDILLKLESFAQFGDLTTLKWIRDKIDPDDFQNFLKANESAVFHASVRSGDLNVVEWVYNQLDEAQQKAAVTSKASLAFALAMKYGDDGMEEWMRKRLNALPPDEDFDENLTRVGLREYEISALVYASATHDLELYKKIFEGLDERCKTNDVILQEMLIAVAHRDLDVFKWTYEKLDEASQLSFLRNLANVDEDIIDIFNEGSPLVAKFLTTELMTRIGISNAPALADYLSGVTEEKEELLKEDIDSKTVEGLSTLRGLILDYSNTNQTDLATINNLKVQAYQVFQQNRIGDQDFLGQYLMIFIDAEPNELLVVENSYEHRDLTFAKLYELLDKNVLTPLLTNGDVKQIDEEITRLNGQDNDAKPASPKP